MQAPTLFVSITFCALFYGFAANADDDYEIEVNHNGFENERIQVPAGTRIKLEVDNESDETVEFFIPAIDLEIGVPAQTEREFYIDPLAAGEYPFENALRSDMRGVIVAK